MTEIWLPRKEIQQQAGILTFITWSDVTALSNSACHRPLGSKEGLF